MFSRFLDLYSLPPEECLFIDDSPENVKTAGKLGFTGIQFSSYDQMAEALKKLGITCIY